MMDHFEFPAEFKVADVGTGTISGYGSVFHAMDTQGDVVLPGAFNQSLAARKASGRGLPPMRLMHGLAQGADPRPIGVWTSMAEDTKGLRVEGRLAGQDTEIGKYHSALIRDGALRGLSIGYTLAANGVSYGRSPGQPRRTLKAINLHELSIVDDPSCAGAIIDTMKSAAAVTSHPDFEEFLRDAGFAKGAARKLASGGWAALKANDAERDDPAILELFACLKAATLEINKGN
jgi:uncharacterized protein